MMINYIKGGSMVIALSFLLLLVVPFYVAGLKLWAIFWFTVGLVLGVYELISKARTGGKTLSQVFWRWRKDNPKKSWWLLAGLLAFWAVLIVHLYWVK